MIRFALVGRNDMTALPSKSSSFALSHFPFRNFHWHPRSAAGLDPEIDTRARTAAHTHTHCAATSQKCSYATTTQYIVCFFFVFALSSMFLNSDLTRLMHKQITQTICMRRIFETLRIRLCPFRTHIASHNLNARIHLTTATTRLRLRMMGFFVLMKQLTQQIIMGTMPEKKKKEREKCKKLENKKKSRKKQQQQQRRKTKLWRKYV